jgi:hypothetical protein
MCLLLTISDAEICLDMPLNDIDKITVLTRVIITNAHVISKPTLRPRSG